MIHGGGLESFVYNEISLDYGRRGARLDGQVLLAQINLQYIGWRNEGGQGTIGLGTRTTASNREFHMSRMDLLVASSDKHAVQCPLCCSEG